MMIYEISGLVTMVLLAMATFGLALLVFIPVLLGWWIFVVVQVILAAVAAGQARPYRYPLTTRMIN